MNALHYIPFQVIISKFASITLFSITLFLTTTGLIAQTNPISGYSGFQVITEGNFTFTGNLLLHGPLAIGANLVIANSNCNSEINIDAVGSYVEPATASSAGLLIKGLISWPASGRFILKVLHKKLMFLEDSSGSDTETKNGSTQIYPNGGSFNNLIRIEGNAVQNPPNTIQQVDFNFNEAFEKFRASSSELNGCLSNVQLYTISNTAIPGNIIQRSQIVKINSLNSGSNYLNLSVNSLNNISHILFEGPNGIPNSDKPLIISIASETDFTWFNPILIGVNGPAQGASILWNFYSNSNRTLTIAKSNAIVGTILAPKYNINATLAATNSIDGLVLAKSAIFGNGTLKYYPFSSIITCNSICDCRDNIVRNPNFEYGTLHWTTSCNCTDFNTSQYASQCGMYMGQLEGTNNLNLTNFYQDFDLVGGSQLNFSFKGNSSPLGNSAKFGLIFFNGTNSIDSTFLELNHVPLPGQTLYNYATEVTAPLKANKIRVIGKTEHNRLEIDQVCLSVSCIAIGGIIANFQTICSPADPNLLTSVVNASVSKGVMIIQWESSLDSMIWSPILNANAQTYDPPSGLMQSKWYRRKVKSNLGCFNYSNIIKVTVNRKPNAGIDQTIYCGGSVIVLNDSNIDFGIWSQQLGNPTGASLNTTLGGLTTATFTNMATGTFNFIKSLNSCSDTISVFINLLPATPGIITGNAMPCRGSTGLVYSINNVTGATNYIWDVPIGWTLNAGQGTARITVRAGGCNQGGNISVRASNSCGMSNPNTLAIVVQDNILPTASNPANIIGLLHLADTGFINPLVVIDEADNCSTPIVTFHGSSHNGGLGRLGDPFILTRTYRVTDACSNTVDVNHSITVEQKIEQTCSISRPVGSTVYKLSDIITIDALLEDIDGVIDYVEFYINGVLVGSDNLSPYSFVYSNLSAGYKILSIKSINNKGFSCTSLPVVVYVNAPPICGISNPLNGAILYDPPVINVNATAVNPDSGSIVKVEFYKNNILIGEDFSFPYSFPILNEPIGSFFLKIRATDNFNASCETSNITITAKCVREDLNDDATVNASDYLLFLSVFGSSCLGCRANFNDDHTINTSDYLLFLGRFGITCN